MNITVILQLRAKDFTNTKPNYAALARKYNMDYKTVKNYHEGYHRKPKNRSKPSKLDGYKVEIIEKLNILRTTMKAVHEFLIDQYGMDKIDSYSNFKTYCKKNKLKPKKSSQPGDIYPIPDYCILKYLYLSFA